MASNYKLLTDTPAGTTSHIVLTATASSTVVASVVATDSSAGTTLEVLVKKAAGSAVILASRALTTANVPEEMLTAPVALEVNDVLYVRTSRTGAEFVTSYVEDVAAVAGQSIDVLSDVDTTGAANGEVLTYNSTSGNWEPAVGGGGTTINALDDINDVQVPTPTGGDTITWNSGASKWISDSFLQDLKERIGKTVAQTGVYNTLNDTTKGFAQYNADGFDAGKNNTRLALSENSPGIIDFSVQDDDAVTPTETQAMRITNSTGGTTDPQIIMGTSTVAQAGNVLTVNGDANVQGDITVTGSINGSITTQNISDIIVTAGANNDILRFDGTNWLNEAEASAFSRINGDSGSAIAEVVSDALAVNGANGITTVAENTTDSLTITFDGGMDNLSDATITSPALNQVLQYNGSAWVNTSPTPYSYMHDQTVAASTWTVTHNLDNSEPLVQVYDSLGEMIVPQTITVTNSNTVSIVFASAIAGKARVGGGASVGNPFPNMVFVGQASDFPTAVSNVITLSANVTYFITDDIDLAGDRLVGGQNTTIIGGSSENCKITSTGLGAGVALFTTAWTTPIRHITFYDVDTAIDIEGATNAPVALDWTGVNFLNVPNIGTIDTCDNWIYSKGAFLNSKGLVFDGTTGTIGVDNSIFVGPGSAGSLIEIAPTATITRRFRIIYSSIVAFGSTTGLDVDSLATVPVEGFILDTVNFSGGSTYLPDVDNTSNEARFENCKGITNTSVNGQMYMQGNATATTITASNTFYKVAGTTTASTDNAKFTHTSNRLTCDATLPRKFMVTAHLSFTAGNNQDVEFGFYDSTLAAVRTPSRTVTTTDGGGSAQNVGFSCVTTMEDLDYIEIHCANNTSTTNVTVTNLNVLITEV